MAGLITQAHNAKIALTSLDDLFDTPIEQREGGAFVSREQFRGDIAFNNVSFSYPNSETPSLSGVSLGFYKAVHIMSIEGAKSERLLKASK